MRMANWNGLYLMLHRELHPRTPKGRKLGFRDASVVPRRAIVVL